MMATLVCVFLLIHRHYEWFRKRILVDEERLPRAAHSAVPIEPGMAKIHAVIPVDDVNRITLGAVALAREISPRISAVHVSDDRAAAERFRARWEAAVPDVPLLVVESPYRAFIEPMVAFTEHLRAAHPDETVTLVLPAFRTRHWWEGILHNRDVVRLEKAVRSLPQTKTVLFTYDLAANGA